MSTFILPLLVFVSRFVGWSFVLYVLPFCLFVLIYLLLLIPTSACYMRVFSLANHPHKSHSIPGVNPSRVLVKFLRATPGFQPDTLPLWGFKGPGGSPEMSVVFVMPINLANWNSYTVQNENVFLWFFWGWRGWRGSVLDGLVCMYLQRRLKYILISMQIKIHIHRMFPIGQTNLSAYTVEFFNEAHTGLERCQSIKCSFTNTPTDLICHM